MLQGIVKNNKAINWQLVEPNKGKQLNREIREREKILLKILSSMVTTHGQGNFVL
jgi:hypothetical protein